MNDKLRADLIRFFNSVGQLGLNAASDVAADRKGTEVTITENLYNYCDLIDGDIRKIREMLEDQD